MGIREIKRDLGCLLGVAGFLSGLGALVISGQYVDEVMKNVSILPNRLVPAQRGYATLNPDLSLEEPSSVVEDSLRNSLYTTSAISAACFYAGNSLMISARRREQDLYTA